MGELGVQQADGVAPGAESARPILYASFPRYLGDFVLWNKIANLAQKVKPTTCWFDAFFVFHPCRVAGSKRQANTFFIFCGMAVKPLLLRSKMPAARMARLLARHCTTALNYPLQECPLKSLGGPTNATAHLRIL